MHVTKYGYNEFGPMVPWASLYTNFTVYTCTVNGGALLETEVLPKEVTCITVRGEILGKDVKDLMGKMSVL